CMARTGAAAWPCLFDPTLMTHVEAEDKGRQTVAARLSAEDSGREKKISALEVSRRGNEANPESVWPGSWPQFERDGDTGQCPLPRRYWGLSASLRGVMPYTAQISRTNPACILLLIDQSRSMAEPFVGLADQNKAGVVADAVNRLLQNVVLR